MVTQLQLNHGFLEGLARFGYAARGVVYALVGALAVLAALGSGGQTGGSHSALSTLLGQPFGKLMLGAIAIGLAGFGVWRFVQSITDADRRGTDWRGLAIRSGQIISGVIHFGLAFSATGLALGWASSGGDEGAARDWTAWLLSQPFGQWLTGGIGLGIAAAGCAFIIKAWRNLVGDQLICDARTEKWVLPIGRVGVASRGIVFIVIGGFLVLAAIRSSSAEARGLGGALATLQGQPYGWLLLGIVAAGLFAFGVFGLLQAVYRRIDTPETGDARDALSGTGLLS